MSYLVPASQVQKQHSGADSVGAGQSHRSTEWLWHPSCNPRGFLGLQGVGPATGSAILSAFDSSIPWMSDEAMAAALGSKDYTVKKFKELLDALRKKAAKLTSEGAISMASRGRG